LIAQVSERSAVVDLTVEDCEIEEVIRAIYLDKAQKMRA
jgi:ABC-type uncharacterized transport system ATPase subunit